MSSPPDLFISAFSRRCVPSQEAELAEFVKAAIDADIDMFVEKAMYCSNSDCCFFTFRYGLTESEDVAEKLLEIATKTISQFEWFGVIHHGRGAQDG